MRYAAAAIGMTFATNDIRLEQADRRAQRSARRARRARKSVSTPSKPRSTLPTGVLFPHPTS